MQNSTQYLSETQVYCTAACLQSYQQCQVTGKLTACGVQSTGSEEDLLAALRASNENGQTVTMWLPKPSFENQTWSWELPLKH